MSFGAPAPESQQPEAFEFTSENLERAKSIIAKYPDGRQQSALLPLLDLAQRQNENWLPRAAMDYVSELLEIPPIRTYEVASFYTMFNKAPVGRHLIQVCTTTPCWLCGSNEVLKAIKEKTGLSPGQSSADGAYTVVEVECLGACVNAPMVQINDDFYEDLDYQGMGRLIDRLDKGEAPKIGSQIGRKGSQALSGPTTLLELPPVVVTPKEEPKTKRAKATPDKAAPDEAKPAGAKPAGAKPAGAIPAETKPAETKPAEAAPAVEQKPLKPVSKGRPISIKPKAGKPRAGRSKAAKADADGGDDTGKTPAAKDEG